MLVRLCDWSLLTVADVSRSIIATDAGTNEAANGV